jgi:hypothetical protein
MKRLAIISTALLVSGAADAQYKNGNTLLEECRTAQSYFSGQRKSLDTLIAPNCMAYVAGISDMLDDLAGDKRCVPDGVTVGQLVDVVVRYLEQKPEIRHTSAAALAMTAIRNTWCPTVTIKRFQ